MLKDAVIVTTCLCGNWVLQAIDEEEYVLMKKEEGKPGGNSRKGR